MFELQHAPSSGSEAEGEASENPEVQAKPSPEGEDPENSASQSESLSENEMDQQQMEALFSDNGHVVALRNFKKKIRDSISAFELFKRNHVEPSWGVLVDVHASG